MMFSAVFRSMSDIVSRELRRIVWRSIALTILILVLISGIFVSLFDWMMSTSAWLQTYPWIEFYLVALTSIGVFVTAFYMMPAVSMLVAGFFLDDVAAIVERRNYPHDPQGRAMATTSALIEGARFFFVTLIANLLALIAVMIPGVNIMAFFVVNAYLFGREYFYLVAGRHHARQDVATLYQANLGTAFAAGIAISVFVLVPVLNLLTPLFATVVMVHVLKRLERPKQINW